ncbi:alpha/beta hydrolase [Frigidibacter sp. MR17.14]|uniref:alpha/beta fold hydrolase n=1 Tax=Frigidibacter sp. MR17.14 TaxID=3126509 RepID=UPI0030131E41
MTTEPILLVHGAWCDAGAWGRVPALLRAAGHEVIVPTLPGQAAHPDPASVGLDEIAAALARAIGPGRRARVVGHSLGGMAIAALAEHAPERVASLIWLCAFLPQDGDSATTLMARQPPTIAPAIRRTEWKGGSRLDPALALPVLAQDLTGAEAEAFAASLVPQPNRPQTEPLRRTPATAGIPRHYLLCTRDRAITPALQRAMAEAGDTPITPLDADHFPQRAQPEALTAALLPLL